MDRNVKKYSTVIAKLTCIAVTKRRMQEKIDQLNELQRTYLSASDVMAKRISKADIHSPVEGSLTKLSSLETKVEKEIKQYCKQYQEGCKIISSLIIKDNAGNIDSDKTEVCKSILECRYLRNFSWDKIAHQTGYSSRHVHRLHDESIKFLQKIF